MVFKLNFVITIVEKHLKHLGTDFFFFFLTKESQSQGNWIYPETFKLKDNYRKSGVTSGILRGENSNITVFLPSVTFFFFFFYNSGNCRKFNSVSTFQEWYQSFNFFPSDWSRQEEENAKCAYILVVEALQCLPTNNSSSKTVACTYCKEVTGLISRC